MPTRLFIALSLGGFVAIAAAESPAESIPGSHRLTHLAMLVGDWALVDGTGKVGSHPFVRYLAIADGSAVVERLSVGEIDEVMSVYHLDGRTLQLTQYSPYHAHPTLREQPSADKSRISFEQTTGASLDPKVSEFIQRVQMRARPDGDLELHWVRFKGGEAVGTLDFRLRRMKSTR